MHADDIIRDLTARQYGAVARRQLLAAGLSKDQVRRRIGTGHFERAGLRVLVLAGSPALAARDAMVAVLDGPPGTMLSHRSAAAWWGLPGFDLSGTIEVTVPRRGAPRLTQVARWHYLHPVPPGSSRVLRGIPVTAATLTLLHLGAVCHEERVRRAVNNALARRMVTVGQLRAIRRELGGSGRNGVGVLAGVLDEIGDGYVPTDSGVEMRLADIARSAGVELERQVWVGNEEERIGRADFRLVSDGRGLVELLSFTYHAMFLDRLTDEHRFRRLERAGFTVLQIWDTDVWNRPNEVARPSRTSPPNSPDPVFAHRSTRN